MANISPSSIRTTTVNPIGVNVAWESGVAERSESAVLLDDGAILVGAVEVEG